MNEHELPPMIPLAEAAAMIPSRVRGKRFNVETLRRWCIAKKVPGAAKLQGGWFIPRDWLMDYTSRGAE